MSTLPLQISSKVTIDEETGCWQWQGSKNKDGYGQGYFNGRHFQAHRIVWELLRGPIPDGLVCDHFMMNPGPWRYPCSKACVNPEHIQIISRKENTNRGRLAEAQRGHTRNRGEKQGNSKLTEFQVSEIRSRRGVTQAKLAKEFGVGPDQISRIINYKRWKHC